MRRFPLWLGLALVLAAALPAAALAAPGRGDAEKAAHALQHVKDLRHGVGVRTGRELTPGLLDLARRRDDLATSAQKQEADGFLARPTDSSDSDYYGTSFIGDVHDYCP